VQCNIVDDPVIQYCNPQVIIFFIFIDVHVMVLQLNQMSSSVVNSRSSQ